MLSLLPGGDHETFETGQARTHDLVGAEFLAGELKEQGRPVVLQGPLDEPGLECPKVAGSGLAKAEVSQDFLKVTGPGLGPLTVLGETSWSNAKLPGQMADGGWGCGMEPGGHEAQIAEGTHLQGETEAVLGTPLALDQLVVAFGEGEIHR